MRGMALLCSSALLLTGAVNVHAEAAASEVVEETETASLPELTEMPEEPVMKALTQTKPAAERNEGYDLNPPVIESISIDKQGQTLADGDAVKISVKAYDAGVGIEKVFCVLQGGNTNYVPTFQYNSTAGLWEASYTFDSGNTAEKVYMEYLHVADKNGNVADGIVSNDSFDIHAGNADEALYWFHVAAKIGGDQEPPVIQSFEMPKRQLSPGDKLEFTVHASDNHAFGSESEAVVSTEDGEDYVHGYCLHWNAEKQAFYGDYSVEEENKPGQYKIVQIEVCDEAGNEAFIEPEGEFFTIVNEDYDLEKPKIKSVFMERAGETLHSGDSVKLTVEAADNREVKSVEVSMRVPSGTYIGSQGNRDISLNRIEGTDRWEGSFVVDDKTYPSEWYIDDVMAKDATGNRVWVEAYENGNYQYSTNDYSENIYYLEEKYYVNVVQDGTFVEPMETISFIDFIMNSDGEIYDCGYTSHITVPRRATLSEVRALCPQPVGYEGFTFEGWFPRRGSVEEMGDREICWKFMDMRAVYDKSIVRMELYDERWYQEDDTDPIYYDEAPEGYLEQTAVGFLVGKPGETLELPTEISGYQNLKWRWQYPGGSYGNAQKITGGSIVIGEEPFQHISGSVTWSSDGAQAPNKPTAPSAPDTPVRPSHAEPVALSERQIAEAAARVTSAGNGTAVTVAMGDATVVPKGILEAAKGKDVDVVLQMDGYFWTINGKDILSSNLKDINLKVIRNTEYIPSSRISQLAGTNPVEQITLEYEGDFGFTADLTMNIGSQYAGKTGNLYWHDSDGRMIFMNAGAIDGAGNVTLGFSHASDYAIVITDSKAATASNTAAASVATPAAVAPKTGDELPVVPYAVLCMIGLTGLLTAGVVVKKRRMK